MFAQPAQFTPTLTQGPVTGHPPSPAPAAPLPALLALCTLARMHHRSAEPLALQHQLALGAGAKIGASVLLQAAQILGLKAKLCRVAPQRLAHAPLPALALLKDGSTVLLAQCDTQRVLLKRFAAAQGGSGGGNDRP